MKDNFEECLRHVLHHEGGFVNDPQDPGGATNMGVTIGTMRKLGLDIDGDGDVDVADVRSIPKATVAAVYRGQYWNAVKGDDLPAGLDLVAFDGAVNSGPARGAKWLQLALGVPADGHIGDVTLGAARRLAGANVVSAACDARLSFLRGLKTWKRFGKGWSSRVESIRTAAIHMAQNPPVQAQVAPKATAPQKPATLPPATKKPGSLSIWGMIGAAVALGIAAFAEHVTAWWHSIVAYWPF